MRRTKNGAKLTIIQQFIDKEVQKTAFNKVNFVFHPLIRTFAVQENSYES